MGMKGRDAEFAGCATVLDRVGGGPVALVEGEAGIGLTHCVNITAHWDASRVRNRLGPAASAGPGAAIRHGIARDDCTQDAVVVPNFVDRRSVARGRLAEE